MTHHDKHCQ